MSPRANPQTPASAVPRLRRAPRALSCAPIPSPGNAPLPGLTPDLLRDIQHEAVHLYAQLKYWIHNPRPQPPPRPSPAKNQKSKSAPADDPPAPEPDNSNDIDPPNSSFAIHHSQIKNNSPLAPRHSEFPIDSPLAIRNSEFKDNSLFAIHNSPFSPDPKSLSSSIAALRQILDLFNHIGANHAPAQANSSDEILDPLDPRVDPELLQRRWDIINGIDEPRGTPAADA